MTPPDPITYRFERADCWRLGRVIYRPSLVARLRRLLSMAVFLLIGLALGSGGWPTARMWAAFVRTPELVAIAAAALVLSQFSHYVGIVVLWARFRSLAIADKTVTLVFDDDALRADVEGTSSIVPWKNFISRIDTQDGVFLKIGRWEAVTIPRRAFADDASWRAALAFLREKVPHGEA